MGILLRRKECWLHNLSPSSWLSWGQDRPSYCGLNEFHLACIDNVVTTLMINNTTFRVLSIDQNKTKITLASNDIRGQGPKPNACLLRQHESLNITTFKHTVFSYIPGEFLSSENPKKTRRERENSLNSRAENSPTRFHHGIPRTRGREKRDDRNVFNRLSHRRKSVHERLSDTYSPSATKSGPSRTDSRNPSCSGESYGDTYSRGTRTKYRDRSSDEDRFCSVKRWRESESSSSESSTSNGGHWKSRTKRRNLVDEDDLAVPWTCEDVDPFTPRIRNFKSSRKTRMPNNVKTYDRTGDLEDHLKIFQAATQLPPESIDGYKGLKAAFLAYFMQLKKYVKDPVEIHNIKQRDGETIEDFMERFKVETGRMKGAPECMKCMRISGFMHGVNNPKLTKRLNEHLPKTMEEMMTVTTAFMRGEDVAASKKKGHLP
ncbi:hypothetical protein Tco_0356132 [Tanacetum coccineum]